MPFFNFDCASHRHAYIRNLKKVSEISSPLKSMSRPQHRRQHNSYRFDGSSPS